MKGYIESGKPSELHSSNLVFNGVRLSKRVMPARQAALGGDWCEAFVLSKEILALSIGDVSGHGPDAFAAMALTRQAVRDAAFGELDPAQILTEANRFLYDFDPQLQATAFFALLDTRRGTMSFANAGHPPPLLVDANGSGGFLTDLVPDLPLGIENILVPELHDAIVPARSLLVFYTDGVTEHKRQPLCGEAELLNAAMFAYTFLAFPTASALEEVMNLKGDNHDDASILTAWTPTSWLGRPTEAARLRRKRSPENNWHNRCARSRDA